MAEDTITKVTVPALKAKKECGQKITALTAYDFPSARVVDEAGVDLILVGDSLGMVVLGYENTVPVTMEEMLHHTRAVTRAVRRALVVGDMPYFSFHLSRDETVRNASRFLKEGGAAAVKVEGASAKRLKLIEAMVEAEIPVLGHVGLTPQSIHHLGRFKVRGKCREEARQILDGALNLERAGVFAVVLECIPQELAREVTKRLRVPTIGIGAGPHCNGQILVFHDLTGFTTGYLPKFVKKYLDLHELLGGAVRDYARDVRSGAFPEEAHSFHLPAAESKALPSWLRLRKRRP
ncbi:MAG: 3-methyl-2-oxobutanoate hydroxymethyltransferase [Candidatus Aminicenantes bacterium RBG_13_62_12]|nr:MAG: 3-methyl-2-oxobutanoate hydroxymethyltransferase [Candidatus Aminicenantes bacterium RBG_13_62_12]